MLTARRILVLRRETLTALTAAELAEVAGGDAITADGRTCPLLGCAGVDISRFFVVSCPCQSYPNCEGTPS